MCQLNLYIVKNEVNEKNMIDNLELSLGCGKAEKIVDDDLISDLMENFENYDCYTCASMGCNCGTVQCSLANHKNYKSYNEYFEAQKKEEKEMLVKVKDLLESPDYKEKLASYNEEYEKLLNDCRELQGKVRFEDFQNSEQLKNFQKFTKDNKFYFKSTLYSLEKSKDSLNNNIYDAIESLENSPDMIQNEYNDLLKLIDWTLELTDEIILYSFWQDNSPLVIESTKTVSRKDLKIEDVVFLSYHDILRITK